MGEGRQMSGGLLSAGRRAALGLADQIVTLPVLRWTWRGQTDHAFAGDLPDFRPADRDDFLPFFGDLIPFF